jgi:PAS domain S-box-containing protein
MNCGPGDQAETYHRKDLELLKNPRHQVYEFAVRDKSGRNQPVVFAKDVFRDETGKVAGIIGAFLDISSLKQAEKSLAEVNHRLRLVLDTIPVRVFWKDRESRYLGANQPFAEDAGVTNPEELIGKTDYDLAFAPQAKAFRRDDRMVMESGKAKLLYKEPQNRPDGNTSWLLTSKVPIRDAGQNVIGVLGTYQDITDRVRIEEMMIQSEKMLSVGGLAAGMAHEINNPLAGMVQTAAVMEDRLSNLTMKANQKAAAAAGLTMEAIGGYMESRGILRMIRRIRESGGRAAEIVNNMLSFARKSDAAFSSQDLSDLLDRTVELAGADYDLKKEFDFRQIEIVRQYAENLPPVPCEAGKIQQVLFNILRNGAEAMQEAGAADDGPGPAERPRFTLRVYHKAAVGRVGIEIGDNGPGMSDEVRKRVFEPFFTTKPTDRGTGLGLSVSYFIITENHGGDMRVISEKGHGTTFIIELPIQRIDSGATGDAVIEE